MNYLTAGSSKGQIKIQQMAFVLVAIMVFFGIVFLFYLSIRSAALRGDVESLREDEIRESVRKFSANPEVSWTVNDCSSCIDMDKAIVLKGREAYEEFWDVMFLQIERIYPVSESDEECGLANYPDCKTLTLKDEGNYIAHSAFVSLCRHDADLGVKCELGKIIMGFRSVG